MAPSTSELHVIEFGPARAIGMSMRTKGDPSDFAHLWQKELFPRVREIVRPEQAAAFGVCRCVPGASDGSFEYLALLEARPDAPVPADMLALEIPRCQYAVFRSEGLAGLGAAWRRVPEAMGAQSAWKPYCGPDGCECATHPSFEYHASDSHQTGQVLIYVPVRPA